MLLTNHIHAYGWPTVDEGLERECVLVFIFQNLKIEKHRQIGIVICNWLWVGAAAAAEDAQVAVPQDQAGNQAKAVPGSSRGGVGRCARRRRLSAGYTRLRHASAASWQQGGKAKAAATASRRGGASNTSQLCCLMAQVQTGPGPDLSCSGPDQAVLVIVAARR
eukprot:jgi/Chlat1/3415/Chrsp23S03819